MSKVLESWKFIPKTALNSSIGDQEAGEKLNSSSKSAGSFICYPESGGRIDSLRLPIRNARTDRAEYERHILRELGSYKAIQEDESYNNTLLFPFPNRLYQGCYSFNGQRYTFPINDSETGNALHGFLFDQSLQPLAAETDIKQQNMLKALHLGFKYAGWRACYPFNIDVEVFYHFNDKGGFHVDIGVINTGKTAAPIAAGWHPYFTFGHSIDILELDLPPMRKVHVDQNMIPTGRKSPFSRFLNAPGTDLSLGQQRFDTCFSLNAFPQHTAGFQSLIYSPVHDFTLAIEQSSNLPYLQLFTPADRQSLALEPVSANINAFRNGEGLCVLEPGEQQSYHIQISLHEGRVHREK